MSAEPSIIDWDALIHGSRIRGQLYRDPAVFEAEFEAIWHKVWVYVGLEKLAPFIDFGASPERLRANVASGRGDSNDQLSARPPQIPLQYPDRQPRRAHCHGPSNERDH